MATKKGYRCPRCGAVSHVVATSTGPHNRLKRRRECASRECLHRFNTIELEMTDLKKACLDAMVAIESLHAGEEK